MKTAKFNDKDRILKAATEKMNVTYKVTPHYTISKFLNRNSVQATMQ